MVVVAGVLVEATVHAVGGGNSGFGRGSVVLAVVVVVVVVVVLARWSRSASFIPYEEEVESICTALSALSLLV